LDSKSFVFRDTGFSSDKEQFLAGAPIQSKLNAVLQLYVT
jgi:hypothetical protein